MYIACNASDCSHLDDYAVVQLPVTGKTKFDMFQVRVGKFNETNNCLIEMPDSFVHLMGLDLDRIELGCYKVIPKGMVIR